MSFPNHHSQMLKTKKAISKHGHGYLHLYTPLQNFRESLMISSNLVIKRNFLCLVLANVFSRLRLAQKWFNIKFKIDFRYEINDSKILFMFDQNDFMVLKFSTFS